MNTLDTRDLNERLEELRDLQKTLEEAKEALDTAISGGNAEEIEEAQNELDNADSNFSDSEAAELRELEEMKSEIPAWRYGETLIPETDWEEYVEELCIECGYISRNIPYWIKIDWEETASNVAIDYSTIEYQGETYYFRNY